MPKIRRVEVGRFFDSVVGHASRFRLWRVKGNPLLATRPAVRESSEAAILIKKSFASLLTLLSVAFILATFAWFILVLFAKADYVISPVQSPPKTAPTSPTVAKNAVLSPLEVKSYITAQAKAKGVNILKVQWIVNHESQYGKNMRGDDGNSRGYWQISPIYHPEVSDKCADSLPCSTAWALDNILKGHIDEWSTWKYRHKWYPDAVD